MQNKNKNNAHFQIGSLLLPLMIIAVFLPGAILAQGAPSLPPLPPLPGTAPAPAVEKAVKETEEATEEVIEAAEKLDDATKELDETIAEVPQMEAMPSIETGSGEDMFAAPDTSMEGDELALPDFGLFDPAALEPPTEGEAVADVPPAAEIPDMPEMPEFAADAPVEVPTEATAGSEADLADALDTPQLPDMPILPGFEEPAAEQPKVADAEPKKEENVADIAAPKKEENVADIAAPNLPENKPMDKDLADALPSWVTDETLPSLKPLPQDKDIPPQLPQSTANANQDADDQKSLADLIDNEINSGDIYSQDSASIDDIPLDDEGKRVVWPNNFKTQHLPPEIYKKQYSNANRHLPHAVYQKEIEAHLFGAVGANDGDAVRALLRTGVPLNIRNTMGEDLVMHAVKAGATTTLQLVLALGAAPSNQDRYGATPLHRAVFLGRQDMATILLRAGANSYVNDMSGVTPMAIAVARQDQPMMQTLGYYQSTGNSRQNVARYQPY